MKFGSSSHLAYCTNIHPAESWLQTTQVLRNHVMAVRELLRDHSNHHAPALLADDEPFAIGLRLSAMAAKELLENDHLNQFSRWLEESGNYVFTINGFPYGNFHGTRVKERVFQPDWTTPERLDYTKDLFRILAKISRADTGASVSTLPGSHKSFMADERMMFRQLIELADWLDTLAAQTGRDYHLGLEPEPLGHFENTSETIAFFKRLHAEARDSESIRRRIGLNYDACHFAIEYDDAQTSLNAFHDEGIRLSKIHLSSAIALDPRDPTAINAIRAFDEPTYFHQTICLTKDADLKRFCDLPDFLASIPVTDAMEARVHFHIPLDTEPAPPLRSTRDHVREVLAWKNAHPDACAHYEIETYTWGVLPSAMQRSVEQQIAGEYRWVINHDR